MVKPSHGLVSCNQSNSLVVSEIWLAARSWPLCNAHFEVELREAQNNGLALLTCPILEHQFQLVALNVTRLKSELVSRSIKSVAAPAFPGCC
jgi:hypothetical protein